MKDTRKPKGREVSRVETPAKFRRRMEAMCRRATAHTADPSVLRIFTELTDILCAAYERGGWPEVRRVWTAAKRAVREGGAR